jgi:hypothetical protein
MNIQEEKQFNYLLDYISNYTNLTRETDIAVISKGSNKEMYDYFENNLDIVQFAIAFCYSK